MCSPNMEAPFPTHGMDNLNAKGTFIFIKRQSYPMWDLVLSASRAWASSAPRDAYPYHRFLFKWCAQPPIEVIPVPFTSSLHNLSKGSTHDPIRLPHRQIFEFKIQQLVMKIIVQIVLFELNIYLYIRKISIHFSL